MKVQYPTQYTHALQFRQNKQDCTVPACSFETADTDPFTRHFKQFLLQHSTSHKKHSRPHSVDKTSRTAVNNLIKKSSLYRKLLTSSIDKEGIEDNMSRFKAKFGAVPIDKEANAVVFREFWEEEQKKTIEKSLKTTFQTRFETEAKNNKIRGIEIKSFQKFMSSSRRQEKNKSKQKMEYVTLEVGRMAKEGNHLSVSGNHKEINSKYCYQKNEKNQPNQLRMLKTNKTSTPIVEFYPNQEMATQVQDKYPSITEQKEKNDDLTLQIREEDIKTTKTTVNEKQDEEKRKKKQPATKPSIPIDNRYKNIFSPYNGIQIKYASAENQDSFNNIKRLSYKRSVIPTRTIQPFTRRPVFMNSPQISKGIVFRSKSTCNQYQPCIDGWNISQEQPQQFNDLFSCQ